MDIIASTLFGKARQAVLSVLFEQPERKFYMRELSRISGIAPGPLQHELKQLVQADLVLREPNGNRINYRVNPANPVFPELLGIIQKTCGMPILVKSALEAFGENISHAAIYGSVAKGISQSKSDVDMLVIGNVSFPDIIAALVPIETKLVREISVRLFGEAEFVQRIDEADRFVCGVLCGPMLIVKGDWDGFRDAARTRIAAGTH